MKTPGITASRENYLRTILQIEQSKGCVHASDVAAAMNVSRPSVSRAINLLRQENYILVDGDRNISFTPFGLSAALQVQERYQIFYRFFLSIGVPEDTACLDAGRMEHAISRESFRLFKKAVAGTD